ncbi:MAG: PRC-barrel domain-containing protein [Bacillota bacterium]
MKRSKEIIGAPVISIAGGVQVGTVKGLIINPQQKTVEFLLLNEQESDERAKGIPFRYAEGIGEYAVTVENESMLIEISRIGILQELMKKGINIIGTKVITRKGKYLGDACEFSIDTDSGNLKDIYYQDKERENNIPVQRVITLGKEVLVVDDITAPLTESSSAPSEDSKQNFNRGDEKSSGEQVAVLPVESVSAGDMLLTERELLKSRPSDDLDPADAFIQRQRQFLIGKILLKDLQSREGEVIAWENEVVTDELFEKVYKLGAQKIMELAMAVRD